MANRITILAQLLHQIDRNFFRKVERTEFKPKRKYKSLSNWNRFVIMTFAQLSGRSSLRDMVNHFQIQYRKLYHMGAKIVKRSTLADANNNRDPGLFEAIFEKQYEKCRKMAPKHKFRFKNKLYSMDSSTITLCLSIFNWAKYRSSKGGIKLHMLLDHSGYIPAFASITEAKMADTRAVKLMKLPPGSIVSMDRGYFHFQWFYRLDQLKKYFVTRLKNGVSYKTIKRFKVLKSKGITSDQIILFKGKKSKECPIRLRRVGFRDPETGKHYVYLTNLFHLSAKTIADIYKDRWQIETFFKWIKQNLKIKTFFGTSKNAVLTQIWVALISMLLLAYYKFQAKLGYSLGEIIKLLQLNLFSIRKLSDIFEEEKEICSEYNYKQLTFNFMIL